MATIKLKSLREDFSIPVLGQGTWRLGGATERASGENDVADVAVIRRALEAGLHHIDTAEMYGAGHAEELVAAAIADFPRERLFLTGKVWKNHLRAGEVVAAAKASLRRMKTDYLDLYLIHQVNLEIPLGETLEGMNRLVTEGVVRHIGVSNFHRTRLLEAIALSSAPIVANELHYNLQVREVECTGTLEACRANGVMVIAWRPLRGVALDLPLVTELAAKYHATPVQVALNFLISQRGVVALVKASDPRHLAENVGAASWTMEEEDIERLRREYPGQRSVSEAVPLL